MSACSVGAVATASLPMRAASFATSASPMSPTATPTAIAMQRSPAEP